MAEVAGEHAEPNMGCVEGVLEVGAIGVALAELIAEGCEACEVEMGLLTLTEPPGNFAQLLVEPCQFELEIDAVTQ